ncbi:hypothetical protein SprV_0100280000 [Sparganum proliferum]
MINGVRQDYVLAPIPSSLIFTIMPMDVYCDKRPGIRVVYRTDGKLLNHRRMHLQSHNCALKATTDGDMQRSMDLFAATRDNYGLVIHAEKTVVMHQLPSSAA